MLESTSTSDYGIIVIPETWLDNSFCNSEFIDEQYDVFRKDKSESNIQKKTGGGVLIGVKKNNSLECTEIKYDEIANLEAVCIKITRNNCNIYIYGVYVQYRMVDDTLTFYEEHLRSIEALNKMVDIKDTIVICGDFNFGNRIKWIENDTGFDYIPVLGESSERKTEIARHFTNAMMDNGFFQMSSFANSSGNVLDLIYTNSPELLVVSNADNPLIPTHMSDACHVPIMCMIDFTPEITPVGYQGTDINEVYSFRKANYEDIRNHLSSTNSFDVLYDFEDDVDRMVDEFYGVLRTTFQNFIPKSRIRSSNKPRWHDKELAALKNKRNKEYKALQKERQTGNETSDETFLESKATFEAYRSQLYETFIQQQAKNLKNNPKQFWRHLNSKRKNTGLPDVIHHDGIMAKSDEEKADLFANFFESVYCKHEEDETLDAFISNRDDVNCYDFVITDSHVKAVLGRMDINKGSGFDGIASIFLRECAEQLKGPLTYIFYTSIMKPYYPTAFKIGQLTPIFKSGSKKDVKNYRGVNTMPNIAKVFDIVIADQLKMIVKPRVQTTQHGFIPSRNIDTNLFELSTHIYEAFANQSQLDVFYSDVAKAFDHVDKSKQIRKLARFSLSNRSLLWFKSYLSDRQQYVQVGRAKSRRLCVSSGVGQGTNNGPFPRLG